jgi:putative FmdB family regulatory protein
MPIYEFRCPTCHERVEIFFDNSLILETPSCPACGYYELERVMSCFSYHRSINDRMAGIDTSRPPGSDYYRVERNIGLRSLKKLKELGCEPNIADFESTVEKARKYVKKELHK